MDFDQLGARLAMATTFVELAIEICKLTDELCGLHMCGVALHSRAGRPILAIDNSVDLPDSARLMWIQDGWARDPLFQLLRESRGPVGLETLVELKRLRKWLRLEGYVGADTTLYPYLLPVMYPRGMLGHIRCARTRPFTVQMRRDLWAVATAASVRFTQLGIEVGADASLERLTPRQLDVAQLAGQGLNNPAIGDALSLSVNTVKKHMKDIFRRLEVESRADLARTVGQSPGLESYPPGISRVAHYTIFR